MASDEFIIKCCFKVYQFGVSHSVLYMHVLYQGHWYLQQMWHISVCNRINRFWHVCHCMPGTYRTRGKYISQYLIEAEWRIYASVNFVNIGSDNGLSPEWRQAIIWTNAGFLSTGSLGINFSGIWVEIVKFSLKKCIWKCRLQNVGHFVWTSMWCISAVWVDETYLTLTGELWVVYCENFRKQSTALSRAQTSAAPSLIGMKQSSQA